MKSVLETYEAAVMMLAMFDKWCLGDLRINIARFLSLA
jgi:hypothetical protein